MKRCRLIILLFTLIIAPGIGTAQEPSVIDLRSWDPESQGLQSLSGVWDFVWGSFQPPDNDWTAENGFIMPSTWNSCIDAGAPNGGFGHATFRVRVLLPAGMTQGRLWIEPASTAYELLLDGEVLTRMGTVGTDS